MFQESPAKDVEVNSLMLENTLNNLPGTIEHFVLVTGTKHYHGTFQDFNKNSKLPPFEEDFPRLPGVNFYYNQEDILFRKAKEIGFTWSVARPAIMIGFSPRGDVNFGQAIAVYASICKHLNLPFRFPGGERRSRDIYHDFTSSDFLAKHLIWEATEPRCANEAFNVVNGDVVNMFTLWKETAEYFNLEILLDEDETPFNLVDFMKDKEVVWKDIAAKHNLKEIDFQEFAGCWFLERLLVTTFNDMNKSRERGFLEYQNTRKSWQILFDSLRREKYIP